MSKIYWSWKNIKGSLKRVLDNLTRGYNDSDTWSLDFTMAQWLVPRLKRLKELKRGIPGTMLKPGDYNPEDNYSIRDEEYQWRKWDWIMDQILWSFEGWLDDSEYCSPSIEYMEKRLGISLHGKYTWDILHKFYHNKLQRGLRFFAKYYGNLWS